MKMYIGENIKYYRMKAGMTQEELAERLGVSNKLVWSWEKNRTEPKPEAVSKMLQIFDIDIRDLTKQINANLSYEEYILIEQYRSVPNSERQRIKSYIQFAAEIMKRREEGENETTPELRKHNEVKR